MNPFLPKTYSPRKPVLTAELALTRSEDGCTLHVTGELDLSTKAQFAAALAPLLTRPGECFQPGAMDPPHLDLTALDFLDSAGLEALVRAHRGLVETGSVLHLRLKTPSQPARVLRLGLFHRVFRIDFVA